MIVALAGGIGAARFLDGLVRVMAPEDLFVIGNTGDDVQMHGLHISPDLDTVVYTLSGLANPVHGWGVRGETFRSLEGLRRLGAETWFQLGDQDLATHIYRTARLHAGHTLSSVTGEIALRLGVRAVVRPMSDEPVRTIVKTPIGSLEFQTYFVRRRARDRVLDVSFRGADAAKPARGVLQAIRTASGIVFCPSNPIISIGPILAVPGMRRALELRRCRAVAISPIVGGRALKGPTARMMKSLGMKASAVGVAELYRGLVDTMIIDRVDGRLAPSIERLGIDTLITNTVMSGVSQKKALARAVLNAVAAR